MKLSNGPQDINLLLKVFANTSPDMAATIIEQLFCLHQTLTLAMKYITQHMKKNTANKDLAKILAWQNRKESLWQVQIRQAVICAFRDLKHHPYHLAPFRQKVNMLIKIANRMKIAASHIATSTRDDDVAFMEARDRATRTQPGLLGNTYALQAQLESPSDRVSSAALFDVFHEPLRYAAVWTYLHKVLTLLDYSKANAIMRTLAVRELAEACRFEFQRTQAAVQCYTEADLGPKLAMLAVRAGHMGNVPSLLRVTEEELSTLNDQLLAVLVQFCRRSTTPHRAAEAFRTWTALRETHPAALDRLSQDTRSAVQQLAAIVYFTQKRTAVISMDFSHRFRNQSFVPKLLGLWHHVLKKAKAGFSLQKVDVSDEMLVTKGMSQTYFHEIEEFTRGLTGASLSTHYTDLVAASEAELKERCANVEAELGWNVAIKFADDEKEEGDAPAAQTAPLEDSDRWRSEEEDGAESSLFVSSPPPSLLDEDGLVSPSTTARTVPEMERCLLLELAALETRNPRNRLGKRHRGVETSTGSRGDASKRRRML